MRPKKRVLLIDHDEYRMSIRSFMLTTHAYLVIPAATAQDALDLFNETAPNAIIAHDSLPGVAELLNNLHERDGFIPQIVISDATQSPNIVCDAYLSKPSAAELLDRVKMMCHRKKGPRTATPDVSWLRAAMIARRTA